MLLLHRSSAPCWLCESSKGKVIINTFCFFFTCRRRRRNFGTAGPWTLEIGEREEKVIALQFSFLLLLVELYYASRGVVVKSIQGFVCCCCCAQWMCVHPWLGVISTANCARKWARAPPLPLQLLLLPPRCHLASPDVCCCCSILLLFFSWLSQSTGIPTGAESQMVLYGVGRRHFTVIIIKRFRLWLHVETRQGLKKEKNMFYGIRQRQIY